jgi:bifunctional DNA-binding transcriptional regulator/antitoxin component of YhaV-PrlF toxin-antitoxin module
MPLTWVDEKGRVKLQGRLRRKLGIEICEEITVELGQDCLILKKVSPNASIEDILETAKKVNTKKQADENENNNQPAQKQILDF